jgi:ACS family tartrate transporter-like MFS transporter
MSARVDDEKGPRVSATVFGFGTGIFFIGYFIFEVPSNMILKNLERDCGSPALC